MPRLQDELTRAPELWLQKGYLARVITRRDGVIRDAGIQPLHRFVEDAGPDAVAATIEMNAKGDCYPVLYLRRGGALTEAAIDGHPLNDFRTPAHERQLAAAVAPVLP